MKPFLSLILLLNISFSPAKGQTMLTNREVYDFNIGDELQSKTYNIPPNAQRITITGKYFSVKGDTVFYVRHFDNYSSSVNWSTNPPHMDYSHASGNDFVHFTQLDSLINAPFQHVHLDSCDLFQDSLYYSSRVCKNEVYEYQSCAACCFEGQSYNGIYGKGLGLVYYHYSYAAEYIDESNGLFYYKKGAVSCGTRDTISFAAITEIMQPDQQISLYPNPATDNFTISSTTPISGTIKLYNALGQLVLQQSIVSQAQITIDVAGFSPGLYQLNIVTAQGIINRKLMIK